MTLDRVCRICGLNMVMSDAISDQNSGKNDWGSSEHPFGVGEEVPGRLPRESIEWLPSVQSSRCGHAACIEESDLEGL